MRVSYKVLHKKELQAANIRAFKAGFNSIEPDYIKDLPDGCLFPVFFTLPIERGWMRCQIGTASDAHAKDYMPLWLDVPHIFYENLHTVEIDVDEEEYDAVED